MEILLPEFPRIVLGENGASLARNGNLIFPEDILKVMDQESDQIPLLLEEKTIFRLFSVDGQFLALGRKDPEKNGIHPFLVIDS
jgi:tRNA pseudouridine55 synthase